MSETRIKALIDQMTLKEKVALLAGKDNWRTVPVPRLGIPTIMMTDGPHGVRATIENGRVFKPTTSFPTGISMAASWDPALVERVAAALADETKALGCDMLLGPCVNIVRHPLAGRNFESFSEDPYLAGQIGIGWVKGIQSKGVSASLKHYACNNQETERGRGSSEVDERSLREIYLAQFEAIVKEANPWTVMSSYNRINGVYASQNRHLLKDILKSEWGWDGVVVSDWGGNHTIVESIQGGLDLEMPGPAKYYGRLLEEAVTNWQIDLADVEEAARRVLRLIERVTSHPAAKSKGVFGTPQHQALARELAEASITLLKNDQGVLPIHPTNVQSIAVIGPMAAVGSIGGGGSSFVTPPYRVSPLEGLTSRLGDRVEIVYEEGCNNYSDSLPLAGPDVLASPDGNLGGLRGQYYANPEFAGTPAIDRIDASIDRWFLSFAPFDQTPAEYSVRWTGRLIAPRTGRFTLQMQASATCRLWLDGKLVVDIAPNQTDPFPPAPCNIDLQLTEGQSYDLRVDYIRPGWLNIPWSYLRLGYTPLPDEDNRIEQAMALAKQAGVAIVFAGWPEGHESEGRDRTSIALMGEQDALIRAVAAANPNTVVVLNCGSPVAMPWIDDVAAVVDAYYPGQEGGHAVASILLGEVNPSGKLTVTFPRQLEDTPAYGNFPGSPQKVVYREGIFVGYRHYDAHDVEPLFPFGHGLSYTSFEYDRLKITSQAAIGEPLQVSFAVKNSGLHFGKETAQVYVSDRASSLPRPPKELKGFAKVALQPAEEQTVTLMLDERAFAFYHPERGSWVVEPGEFEILVGASSRDIRLRAVVTLISSD